MANMNAAPAEMSAELVEYLQGPQLVLVTTIDANTKWPSNNLITWVYAVDQRTVRLAADAKGRILNNLRADDRVLLTFMVGEACFTVEGHGRQVAENLDGVSLKLGCAEVSLRAVRDVTFWGGRITSPAQYDVSYDQAVKEKLDSSVFAAMRGL